MKYTISDFYHTYRELLTAASGDPESACEVRGIGLLDYELVPELMGRFYHSNLEPGYLLITTLLYTRDNPFQIGEAVRVLMDRGCAGLVIKNVFRIQIPENVLRLAQSKGFPIFLTESSAFLTDRVIHQVLSRIDEVQSAVRIEHSLNEIFRESTPVARVSELTLEICPSLSDQHFVLCALRREGWTEAQRFRVLERFGASTLYSPGSFLSFFRGALFLVKSMSYSREDPENTLAEHFLREVFEEDPAVCIGTSRIHYYLGEIRQSCREGYYAALAGLAGLVRAEQICRFDRLGDYQLFLPHCRDDDYETFFRQWIRPIEESDAENGTNLFETLLCHFRNHCNVNETAARMDQHPNTIRYRLDRIAKITGLDLRDPEEFAELRNACRIYRCRQIVEEAPQIGL